MEIMFLMDVFIFGGCEKMLVKIIDALIERGYQVTLAILYKSSDNDYLKYVNKNVKIVYLWEDKDDRYLMTRIRFWKSIIFPGLICTKFPEKDFDFIVCFKESYQLTILASRLKSKNKITWIQNIIEFDFPTNKKGLKIKIAYFVYRLVIWKFKKAFSSFDKIICVSEQCKKTFIKEVGKLENIEVKYNFLDEEEVIMSAKESITDYEFKNPVFCYVGRLSQEKGIIRLIKVFNRLIEEGYDIRLIVIGSGYQRDHCQQLISENNNNQYIKLLGNKENPYPYIQRANWCVCSSEKESFGLVILESLLLNTPVISTRCGGPQETLKEGEYGILTENSERGIYEGIKKVLDNVDLNIYYKKKCGVAAKHFSEKKLKKAICDIFI